MKKYIAAFAVTVLGTGCPFGGFIYSDYTTSRNWISLQRNDNSQATEAKGEACASSILGLIATGDAGFDKAYKAALASSGANSLWDVRADTRFTTILGIYSTLCTEVVGKAAK